MFQNTKHLIMFVAVALVGTATCAMAQGCRNYPYRDGIDPDLLAASKFVATSSASVSFDDVDAVKDAREEAEMDAKARLAKFLTEDIKSDSVVAKIVDESKSMKGDGKEAARNESIRRVKVLRNSAQAMLRGVIVLGDCYTKGTEVRVTVGVKPESIKAAEELAGGIKSSVGGQPTAGSKGVSSDGSKAKSDSTKQPLTNVDEYSNTKGLKKW